MVQQLVTESRSFIKGLFDHKCVIVNGVIEIDAGRALRAGDNVSVRFEANRRYSPKPPQPKNRGFAVPYEDDFLIVVEKAPDLLTVPSNRGEPHTLIDRVGEYLSHSRGKHRACVVHRLDRGVSGLLVFGKSEAVAEALQEQFARQKPERVYFAIVAGEMKAESGTFRSYLATGRTLTRFSTNDPSKGEYAETHYLVQQRLRGATVVEIRLATGRRNQIRVQFAEAGHPVLGDDRYMPELARHDRWAHKRIALHARSLGFVHPITLKELVFNSELPAEFRLFVNQAGTSRGNKNSHRPSTSKHRYRM